MNNLSKSPQQDHTIYKIEGLEFLPEGFLELDPLLYKDEYTFESKIQEDMFNKQQRKIKALRRKQYQQKKKQKMRDVVIYVSDEKREKVIDFLEKWYFKNKRRMNDQEIEYCAGLLETTKDKMRNLQDSYLTQMKMQNTEDLKVYLHQKGQMDEQKVTLPISLAKYFVKSKNPYRGVSPRVYEEKRIYNPFGPNYMQGKFRNCKSQNLFPKKKEHFVDRVFKDFDEKTQTFKPEKKVRSSLVQKQPLHNQQNTQKNEGDIQQYFDSKVENILNKITDDKDQSQKKVSFKEKNNLDKTLDKTIKKQSARRNSKSPKRSILKQSQQKPQRKTSPNVARSQPKFKHFQSVANEKQPKQQSYRNSFNQKTVKRVSLIGKTKQGNTIILQKLQPIQVGTQTFYQQIKDEQTPQGRRVSLITTDNQGRIVNQKLLNIQQIGNFYNNFAFRNDQNPQNVRINVQNDLGQIIDIQDIFQHNAVTTKLKDNKRLTLQNLNQNQIIREKNKTIHVLQPVNIAGQFYNNAVEQILEKNKKKFRIVTTDQNGTILEDRITEDDIGEQFYNEVIEGLVNEQGNKKITLNLKNQEGKIIQQQEFLVKIDNNKNSEILDKSFRKSFAINKNINNRKLRVYSMPPIITGRTFLQQQIQEEIDSKKGSMMTIFTFDEKGVELSRDIVNANLATEKYSIQPLKNARGLTIITKNDKGDIINIREVNESEYSNLDYEQDDSEILKFKNRKSVLVSEQKRNDSIIKTYSIKPTIFANNYYKQIVEEVIEGKQKKYTVKTLTKNDEIVSTVSVTKNDFTGDEFYTEMIGNENGQSISVITRNEDNQILLAQEIEKRLEYLFNQQSLKDFDQKSKQKNSIVSKQQFSNRDVISYTIRPAKVNDFVFQQIIQDIIDKEGNKERLLITYDDKGQVIAADIQDQYEEIEGDLEQQFKIDEIDEQRKKITIVVNDENGKEIGVQQITIDEDTTKQMPKKTTITQKDTLVIRNDLGLTKVGSKHYGSVVNEIIKDNQIQYIEVELQDKNRKTIAKKQMGSNFVGNYYDAVIKQIFVDSDGFQRPSIQIQNDNEQVLASFQDRLQVQPIQKQSIVFQNQPITKFEENEVETIRNKNSTIVIKKLRPSYYQGRDYEFYFEEVIDQNGNRRLTLVTKRDNQEISRDKVDQKIANEEHENYLVNLIQEKGKRSTLEFRNNKGRLILKKTLNQKDDLSYQQFDDFQEKFNEHGERESQIFARKEGEQIQKSHLLSPTLVGSEYYQQIVNEIVDKDKKTKNAMVITLDENGRKVSESVIPHKLTGKSYHSQVEEIINDNGIRNFSLITKNDKGTVVSRKNFIPNLNLQQIDEVDKEYIEEIVDLQDNKKINFIEDQKDQQFVLNQSFAKSNKDIDLKSTIKKNNQKDKNEYFEKLLSDYSFTNDPNRYSLNRTKQKDMRNTMHINDINRNPKEKRETIKLNQSLTGNKIESLKDMPKEMIEIYDRFTEMDNQNQVRSNSNFDSLTNYQKDYINSVNTAKDKKNESNRDLDKAVSILFNKEKEKIMAEIVQNLQQNQAQDKNNKNNEDLIEEFQKFCRDVLPKDKEYKESIMLVSLFYYFLKTKKLSISQLNLQL